MMVVVLQSIKKKKMFSLYCQISRADYYYYYYWFASSCLLGIVVMMKIYYLLLLLRLANCRRPFEGKVAYTNNLFYTFMLLWGMCLNVLGFGSRVVLKPCRAITLEEEEE